MAGRLKNGKFTNSKKASKYKTLAMKHKSRFKDSSTQEKDDQELLGEKSVGKNTLMPTNESTENALDLMTLDNGREDVPARETTTSLEDVPALVTTNDGTDGAKLPLMTASRQTDTDDIDEVNTEVEAVLSESPLPYYMDPALADHTYYAVHEAVDHEEEVRSEPDWRQGRRIVDLSVLADSLQCKKCNQALYLHNTVGEKKEGLGGYLHVRCHACHHDTLVPYGKRHSLPRKSTTFGWDVNKKLAIGEAIYLQFVLIFYWI